MKVYAASRLPFFEAGLLFHNAVLVPAFRPHAKLEFVDTATDAAREVRDLLCSGPADDSYEGRRRHYTYLAGPDTSSLTYPKVLAGCDMVVGVLDGTGARLSIVEELEHAVELGLRVVGYSDDAFCSPFSERNPVDARAEALIWDNGGCVVPTVPRLIALLMAESSVPGQGFANEFNTMRRRRGCKAGPIGAKRRKPVV